MKISEYEQVNSLAYKDKIPIESGEVTKSLNIEVLIKSLSKVHHETQGIWGELFYNNFIATLIIYGNVSTETYGWIRVGVISNTSIRPKGTICFTCYDNAITCHANNITIDCKIEPTGDVYAYLYSDHKSAQLRGYITYVIGE